MYNAALHIHSWLRWAVLLFGLLAVARAVAGRAAGRGPAPTTGSARAFTGMLDLQMLIGLIMYFALSPITSEGMRDMGAAMANTGLRFWAVEHPVGMLVAARRSRTSAGPASARRPTPRASTASR